MSVFFRSIIFSLQLQQLSCYCYVLVSAPTKLTQMYPLMFCSLKHEKLCFIKKGAFFNGTTKCQLRNLKKILNDVSNQHLLYHLCWWLECFWPCYYQLLMHAFNQLRLQNVSQWNYKMSVVRVYLQQNVTKSNFKTVPTLVTWMVLLCVSARCIL